MSEVVDIQAMVSQLTLDEKLSLLAGGSHWRTAEVQRLGIPNLKVSLLSPARFSPWRSNVLLV